MPLPRVVYRDSFTYYMYMMSLTSAFTAGYGVSFTLYIYIIYICVCVCVCVCRPPLWSSGQSSWMQNQRRWVRFLALLDFLSGRGSRTGSTQPSEDK
jgi:hypothetical protein